VIEICAMGFSPNGINAMKSLGMNSTGRKSPAGNPVFYLQNTAAELQAKLLDRKGNPGSAVSRG
jgi:hypothetical protein